MEPTGKCPKCEKVPKTIDIEDIIIKHQFSVTGGWNGISDVCPHSKTVLGAASDPVAIKAGLVKELCDALGVKPKKKA